MAAVVVITAAAYGAEAGFMTGVISAFISNFFFGQGPWTPWQMLALGLVGLLSGILFSRKKIEKRGQLLGLAICGGLGATIIYGVIMDTSSVLLATNTVSFSMLFAAYGAGFTFNLIHGVSTVLFIIVLAKPILNKLYRMKKKYGVFRGHAV